MSGGRAALSRGSSTLVITAASCCQCISAQIEHQRQVPTFHGIVIILASGHAGPIFEADLADSTRDPDKLATFIVNSYHEHGEVT